MLIRVLGPVTASFDDGTRFDPPSEGQRKLLALLALRAGRAVAAETICDLFELTPGAVRTTVSRLRKALGEALVTESQGYALHADTDVQRFQALVASAKTASSAQAVGLREEALALFAQPALDEFSDEPWAIAEVTRLTELRSAVVEDLIESQIGAGDYDAAIDQLHRHLLDHPYRDRPHELLMEALALSGRQVEALRAFQDYRTELIEEVGVEPGAAITELDRQISVGELTPSNGDHAGEAIPRLRTPAPAIDSMSNLKMPANDFVGRRSEIEEIGQALANSRLVTLLGPGGVGKTRLSYRVASEQLDAFADGAWVGELVDCETSNDVVRSIADVFGLSDVDTVEECADLLAGHELLLVLDNCEHLVDELATVIDVLLSHTARLKILATSRVRLAVVGEQLVTVQPMRTDGEAQELFISRATASGTQLVEADMVAVGQICERLDGIPLALELAAASSRVLSPLELLDRLEDRFALLKGGPRGSVAGRHESLRAAVDSSYESLDEATQTFFRRIAVFAADFPLSGAEAVAADLDRPALDLLAELVDRSLLTQQRVAGRSRYRLLETLRQYGEDRLHELGEFDDAVAAHAAWCFESSEQLVNSGFGSAEATSLNELIASSPNYRVAIARLLDSANPQRAGDLVLHLEDFGYASQTLVALVAPVVEAGVADTHPHGNRIKGMELIRRASSGTTDHRRVLASELAEQIQVEDRGTLQLAVLLISTALGLGPGPAFTQSVVERAADETGAERARLLVASGLGTFYGTDLPDDLALVQAAIDAAQRAGMKRLTVASASMACIAGLRLEEPALGAQLARPFLDHLQELGHASIMSNGLISMYTEAAIQAGMPASEHLAAIRLAGPQLRGDFNKLGQAFARSVQHHGQSALAVRALGACAVVNRSSFSTRQRERILELARTDLSGREVESLLAAGSVSETTDLYREMWAALEPLMG